MAISDDPRTDPGRSAPPSTAAGAVARVAMPADRAQVEELDAICFPQNDVTLEPADPLELSRGIDNETVLVVLEGERMLAYLHYEWPTETHAYISAIAVHPERRKSGYAQLLLKEFMTRTRLAEADAPSTSISTVTSIRNLSMLSFLLKSGFIVRTVMDDYFGPGRGRVYCQFKIRVQYVDPDERYIVPVEAGDTVERLLRDDNYVITSLVDLPKGKAFEFSRFDSDDFAALESNETAAGVSFSSVVLGAITFLLGFSFASTNFPDPARTLLTGAAFATTISLIIYANTSGESSRLRSNAFGYYMKWGNVLSEYGGVLPLLIALPIALAGVARSHAAVIVSSVILSGSLFLYERSRFSMSSRFARTVATRSYAFLVCVSPLTGVVLTLQARASWPMWVWTSVTAGALAGLSWIYLFLRQDEQTMEARPLGWEPRH